MAENTKNNLPTLGEIDLNPTVISNNILQTEELVSIEEVSSVLQHSANNSVRTMVDGGIDKNKAKEIAFGLNDKENKIESLIVDRHIKNALAVGTDEYAIMAAIHKGTLEGEERSKHSPIVNYIKDIANLVKSKIARK